MYGVTVGVCSRVRPEGWFRWFAHPFVVLCARVMQRAVSFLQALQRWQLGFLVSLYLLSSICPKCAYMQLNKGDAEEEE